MSRLTSQRSFYLRCVFGSPTTSVCEARIHPDFESCSIVFGIPDFTVETSRSRCSIGFQIRFRAFRETEPICGGLHRSSLLWCLANVGIGVRFVTPSPNTDDRQTGAKETLPSRAQNTAARTDDCMPTQIGSHSFELSSLSPCHLTNRSQA